MIMCLIENPRHPRSILRFIQMIPGIIAVLGIVSLWLWLNSSPNKDWKERIPDTDTTGGETISLSVSPISLGRLLTSDGVPANLPGAWPRFRGENFDGISAEKITLAEKWSEEEPKVLWGIDVGEGYAGAAILNGRVYMLDYDANELVAEAARLQEIPQPGADTLRCLSLADGKEIWRYSYPIKIKRNHGMSRTVPAVTEKDVVALGPMCHVICLDSTTGELRWALDLVKDFKTEVPPWYAGQCPLIDGKRTILAPGGDALMIAVDCETGNIIWKTPNPRNWSMTHSSIIPMEFKGWRMYVYCGSGGVVGISADDGSILWETTEWKISIATVPSPLIIGDGRIFLSGGYNAGSMMLQLKVERAAGSLNDGMIIAEPLFQLKPDVFGSTQQTPILFNGYIYGVRPDGQLVCLNLEGELVWVSGTSHRFGLGPYMIANGLIYAMDDSGLLTLVEATPAGYKQLAQSQVLNGHDSWGPMALAGGRLIARDLTRMVCLDVTGK
jgi:outer membrane protein assembly factor BamB